MQAMTQMDTKDSLLDMESSTEIDSDSVPEASNPIVRSQLQKLLEKCRVVALAWIFFLVYEAYIWGLPTYAEMQFADENHTIFERYCWTPAEYITCGANPKTGFKTYQELVDDNENLSYRYKNGKLYGCGCGEGIFADHVCPYIPPGANFTNASFGISQYIGTAPASGAMGAVSMVPITLMWYYGTGASSALANLNPFLASWSTKSRWLLDLLIWGTLLVFQVMYGAFVSFTWCIDHDLHRIVLKPMLFSILFHWMFLSIGIGCKTPLAKLVNGSIWLLCLVAVYGQAANIACNSADGALGPIKCPAGLFDEGLGFWFFECLELSAFFVVAPVLLTINYLNP